MTGHKISILLVRYPGAMANTMCFLTGFPYTHATIGLGEDLNTFYSFVYKGFLIEKITRYLKPDRAPFPCALYQMDVSAEIYERIRALLGEYAARKPMMRYSRVSLVLSLFKIPFRRRNIYFCSHFVAEVLQRSNAVQLKKDMVLYQPKDFHRMPQTRKIFEGNLEGMVEQFQLQA